MTTVTTTRCPRCSRPLLDGREVHLPVHILKGGKVDTARREYLRKHGRHRVGLRALPVHDRARCDAYLAEVVRDCHGYVAHVGGAVLTAEERWEIERAAIHSHLDAVGAACAAAVERFSPGGVAVEADREEAA